MLQVRLAIPKEQMLSGSRLCPVDVDPKRDHSIFVGNLCFKVEEKALKKAWSQLGQVRSVEIRSKSDRNGLHTAPNVAFIEFDSREIVIKVIAATNATTAPVIAHSDVGPVRFNVLRLTDQFCVIDVY
jgi:RNA recognition motif-containing protein